ncbi:MAG: hypothetical protein ABI440_05010 [Casimicrobiaceae bacterium]
MTETAGGNTARNDDWLDDALRAQRPAAVADEGFTARVMAALPPLAGGWVPAWRKPVVATLWTFAVAGIALSLPEVALDLVRDGYRAFTAYPVSLSQLAFAVVAAAAVMWTATGYAVRNGLTVE